MNTFNSSLYAIAFMSCVLCSFVFRSSRLNRPHYSYLSAYLVLESCTFILQWLMLHPTSPGKSLWLGLLMCLSLLLAPCLWLYARQLTHPSRASVRSLSGMQVALIAAGMLLTLPLIQRSHLGPDYADPRHVASKLQSLFIHGTMLASIAVFLCQVPHFVLACRRILREHVDQPFSWFETIKSKPLDTLRVLVLLLATNWLVGLLRTLHCLLLGKDTGLGTAFSIIEVTVTIWAIFTLVRAHIEDTEPVEHKRKYAKSSLDAPARRRIQRKLGVQMREQRLYCDNALSLRSLCQHLRENPHYVSQVINQDFATSFSEFVNQHRIEEAKRILIDAPDKTVLTICLETGFNSKSTFNAAFREYTGMTPTQYRTQHATAMIGTDARTSA
ncbi:MAG: helix-turn-helix domain-containing protein [Povalibacter sp.]